MTAPTHAQWKSKFCRRTAELRDARGWTQQQMADALAIPLERYKKYETRTPLPHLLLVRFALIAGVELAEMFAIDHPTKRRQNSKRAS
jgi:transcriptional regulator with XRE-family HTH domain